MRSRVLGAGALVAVLLLSVLAIVVARSGDDKAPAVVVGSTRTSLTTALPGGTIPTAAPETAPAPARAVAGAEVPTGGVVTLKAVDGRAYGPAIAFSSSVPVPTELTFVLVVGSDARPGEDIRRTNGDSIHLLAVNPRTGQGTVVGLPRDSFVDIPGRGRAKINSALAKGGPGLLAETVRRLTGLPVHYYVLTGFAGLASMVDELGGIDVFVDRRMNDAVSGARFEAGWQHFNGAQALAFSRNRNVPNGDFVRSANQGVLILAALAKMRAEVGDDGGLRRWIGFLGRHAALDVAPDRLLGLAALARGLDPARLRSVVAPGRIGMAGRQSVVYLTDGAARLFADLRDDAVVSDPPGTPPPVPETTTSTPPTTTSSPTSAPTTTEPPTYAPGSSTGTTDTRTTEPPIVTVPSLTP